MKARRFVGLLSILAVGGFLNCTDDVPSGASVGSLSGRVLAGHGDLHPLVGAVLSVGTQSVTTDGGGYYHFTNLPLGLQNLSVSHFEIGSVDSSVHVGPATTMDFVFRLYRFSGGVFRFLLTDEPVWGQPLNSFYLNRRPLAAVVTVDGGAHVIQTSGDLTCNIEGAPLLLAGLHRLQITSADTYPLDTVFVVDREGTCPPDLGGYHFTLTPDPAAFMRSFDYPLSVGTQSRYRYLYSLHDPERGETTTKVGDHRWTVTSMSLRDQDTVYVCTVTGRDSVRARRLENGIPVRDTSYFEMISSTFEVIVSRESIVSNWPSTHGWDQQLHTIPRRYSGFSSSIILRAEPGVATYQIGLGLRQYLFSSSAVNSIYEELMQEELIR